MPDQHRLVCASCGCTFAADRPHALTCSGTCRKRRHDARRAALAADLAALAAESLGARLAA